MAPGRRHDLDAGVSIHWWGGRVCVQCICWESKQASLRAQFWPRSKSHVLAMYKKKQLIIAAGCCVGQYWEEQTVMKHHGTSVSWDSGLRWRGANTCSSALACSCWLAVHIWLKSHRSIRPRHAVVTAADWLRVNLPPDQHEPNVNWKDKTTRSLLDMARNRTAIK